MDSAWVIRGPRAGGVEIGAPRRRAVHVLLDGLRALVRRIHLPDEGHELGQGDVACPAFGTGIGAVAGRREARRALGRQGRRQNVGGRVEIVLRVAADQFLVLGEGDIAFQDPRPPCAPPPRWTRPYAPGTSAVRRGDRWRRASAPKSRSAQDSSLDFRTPSSIWSIRKKGRGPSWIVSACTDPAAAAPPSTRHITFNAFICGLHLPVFNRALVAQGSVNRK